MRQFAAYLALLRDWSKTTRLVGSTEIGFVRGLVDDCQALLPHLPTSACRLVDVGSGAGLPGLVIAAERPDVMVVALEPHRRRWAFLRTARRSLGLTNFSALAVRDDVLTAKADFESFDVAVSKATFPMAEWKQRGRALVGPEGLVLGLASEAQADQAKATRTEWYEIDGTRRAVLYL